MIGPKNRLDTLSPTSFSPRDPQPVQKKRATLGIWSGMKWPRRHLDWSDGRVELVHMYLYRIVEPIGGDMHSRRKVNECWKWRVGVSHG